MFSPKQLRKKKINNKILVILNNNFTAVNMLSYFLQNKKKYKKTKIYLIIDETYKNTFLKRYDVNEIIKILKLIDPSVKNFNSLKVPNTFNFNFKNINFFLKNFIIFRKKNFFFSKKVNNIYQDKFNEIWTGNSEIINFLNINQNVIRFEHGVTEISNYLSEKKVNFKLLVKLKRFFENLISYKLFFKRNYFFEFKLVSVFKNLIKDKDLNNVIKLDKENYVSTLKNLFSYLKFKKKKNELNILINYPLADFSNPKIINKFNYDFFRLIKSIIKKNNINKKYTLIIKRKPSHKKNNIKNLIQIMKKNGIKNKIKIFENIYKTNLIIDFFIEKIKPKLLITNLNSSVIIFKTLFPKNKIIKTDMFVLNFLENNKTFLSNKKIDEFARFKNYKNNLSHFL